MKKNLILGEKHTVSLEELANIAVPPATNRFVPIPHIHLVNETRKALLTAGFEIIDEEHAIHREGLRYFGVFVLTHETLAGERRQIVCGIRNSNDKSFAAAICIGSKVMVCSNLDFSSEYKLQRRHTTNVMRDLPGVIAGCVSRIIDQWNNMEIRIQKYEQCFLTEEEATKLTVNLVDAKALPARDIYKVIQLWRDPSIASDGLVDQDDFIDSVDQGDGTFIEEIDSEAYAAAVETCKAELLAEFGGQSVWGLYNALTEALKGSDLSKLPTRTMTAQSLCDAVVGFAPSIGEAVNDTEIDENGEETEAGAEAFSESFAESDEV